MFLGANNKNYCQSDKNEPKINSITSNTATVSDRRCSEVEFLVDREVCEIRMPGLIYWLIKANNDSVSPILGSLSTQTGCFFVGIVVEFNSFAITHFTNGNLDKTVNHGQRLFLLTDKRNKTGVGGFVHHNLIADK